MQNNNPCENLDDTELINQFKNIVNEKEDQICKLNNKLEGVQVELDKVNFIQQNIILFKHF